MEIKVYDYVRTDEQIKAAVVMNISDQSLETQRAVTPRAMGIGCALMPALAMLTMLWCAVCVAETPDGNQDVWNREYEQLAGQIAQTNNPRRVPRDQARLFNPLLQILAEDIVPFRPERAEPRVRKRRPKAYPLMTKPRQEYHLAWAS